MEKVQQIVSRLEAAVGQVMLGQEETVRRVLASMIAGGHVLLEDYPGTGKTTLAKAISKSIGGAAFQRIQFTPDLLPSDILGVNIFDPSTQSFEFHQGPIVSDILLADEINRASPRTQSALLEAMGEGQATIEGQRHDLGNLFFVLGTQNPVELRGTFPLPEAQMDRFALKCALGYVSVEEEMKILIAQKEQHPLESLQAVVTREDVIEAKKAVSQIRVSDEMQEYIVRLVAATRKRSDVQLAASPRASLNLMHLSQAYSIFEGRGFVVPETVQALAPDVIGHRLVLDSDAKYSGRDGKAVVHEIMETLAVPV